MKEFSKLDDQELENINGGQRGAPGWFTEDTESHISQYLAVGISVELIDLFSYNEFYFTAPDGSRYESFKMNASQADEYVNYFNRHTNEEYIKHVQQVIPGYSQITLGKSSRSIF